MGRIGGRLRVIALLAATVIALGLAAFIWVKFAPRQVPPGQPPLTTLESRSLPGFRDAFNAADREVRILAMLSPT